MEHAGWGCDSSSRRIQRHFDNWFRSGRRPLGYTGWTPSSHVRRGCTIANSHSNAYSHGYSYSNSYRYVYADPDCYLYPDPDTYSKVCSDG